MTHKGTSLYPSIPTFEITTQPITYIVTHTGPDSIHPYALKATAAEVSPTFSSNPWTHAGRVPIQWKHAYVSLVFKKGSKSDPKNYRPISLTVVCKSMEHIIVSQIMKHLKEHNILSDSQFGFRSHAALMQDTVICHYK